jgi:hypothetical protein
MTVLKITRIPQLNSIVLKQEGGRFFIATPNSFIIDRDGLLRLVVELGKIGFVTSTDILKVAQGIDWEIKKMREEERIDNENKENSSNSGIR